jgi:class 3 adenylate cyclase
VVLAEKSLQEVRKPIVSLQLVIMISTVILIILVSIFSLLYSHFFLKPIYTMVNSAREFTKNNTYSQVKINSSDELGTLTYYFNKLISHSRDQHLALEQENNKRKRLMLNFFPPYIVEKMEKGETNMAHNHDNVALLFASFRGLNELIDTDKENNNNNNKNMENLSKLFNSFDAMAKRYEVDKLTLFGNNYVATCGLHKPRIDYARRCVHFSLELFNLVQRFNQEKNANLRLRIGINSGSVTAGIVGKEHFSYGLWGDTISIANRILYDAHADSLRITHKVYEQLTIKEYFQQCPLIHLDTIGEVSTWEYKAECDENGVCKILLPTKNIKDYESSATNHRVTENV